MNGLAFTTRFQFLRGRTGTLARGRHRRGRGATSRLLLRTRARLHERKHFARRRRIDSGRHCRHLARRRLFDDGHGVVVVVEPAMVQGLVRRVAEHGVGDEETSDEIACIVGHLSCMMCDRCVNGVNEVWLMLDETYVFPFFVVKREFDVHYFTKQKHFTAFVVERWKPGQNNISVSTQLKL